MPFSTEIITLLSGSVMGFIFRFMAERAKDRQAQFEMLMKVQAADEDSREAAAKRENNDAGKIVRRIIHLNEIEIPDYNEVRDIISLNRDLRIRYLRNKINENEFKILLDRKSTRLNSSHT